MAASVSESSVFGSIIFVNCERGCPSSLKRYGKPCEIYAIPKGIQFSWKGQTINLVGTAEFIVLFLRNGQVKLILCENIHPCMPRTYREAIQEKHQEAIHCLLEQEIEPLDEDIQLARELGCKEIADLLSNKKTLAGFEWVELEKI